MAPSIKPCQSKGVLAAHNVLDAEGGTQNLNDCRHDLSNTPLQFTVVRDRGADGDLGGGDWRNSFGNHLRGIDQQSGRNAFFKAVTS